MGSFLGIASEGVYATKSWATLHVWVSNHQLLLAENKVTGSIPIPDVGNVILCSPIGHSLFHLPTPQRCHLL